MIDEIVWSRQLVLVFGNTTQALSAILTGFFGGIAIGSTVGGRIVDRIRDPLRMYGILELVLVAVVLATPISFGLIGDLYRGLYPSLENAPLALALVRVSLAVLALAPATILMGATLPTLTRHLTRTVDLSSASSRLYAANTIGAIAGTVVAGIILIELLGLSGTLAVGAACSGIAGLAALWLTRRPVTTIHRRVPATIDTIRRAPRLALAVAFTSGLTSLGYQMTWTRLLASGTGNTTYVFTTILTMFLIGLALGAVVLADISSAYDSPARTVDDWVAVIARETWLTGDAVLETAGAGPLITDDRPRPEYFLLRRLFGWGQ